MSVNKSVWVRRRENAREKDEGEKKQKEWLF